MRHVIAGTAGHIDHGKTALVKALTGIDTDRLAEEKRRGISIDLGFAHLDLGPDLRVGFVDVPGHERFVKNMLAGVGGIDLVLLVIAADESVMPQTREHFDICRLLAIPRGIVALTKADLVEPELLGLARLEAEEFVAGSFLAGAPVVAVSAVTGQGLDELRDRLREVASQVPLKDASRYLRLPIDRAFSMHGFGTVVTGTLISGSVAREQEVELHPGTRRLRVRGVEVHGEQVGRALAGQRTALNLSGVEPAEVARGMVLAEPERFRAVSEIDCRLELLPSARPLKNRAPVHFHAGTAEIEAEVRLLEGGPALPPGASGFARLRLREPLLLVPGDRFIIRMFSPVVTIGGGVVLDSGYHYRRHEDAGARLKVLAEGTPGERVHLLVRESGYGLGLAELVARTGLTESEIERDAPADRLRVLRQPQPWLLDRQRAQTMLARLRETLAAFHQQNPLAPGMPKEELRGRELPGAPAFLLDALIAGATGVVAEGENLRLATHKLVLKQDEEQALEAIEGAFRNAGLAVPFVGEVLAKCGVEPARARSLLQMLMRRGRLAKLADELVFHVDALEELRRKVSALKGRRLSVPEFKDLAGVSRKYAIPLLEYLDRERVTRRDGDTRQVL